MAPYAISYLAGHKMFHHWPKMYSNENNGSLKQVIYGRSSLAKFEGGPHFSSIHKKQSLTFSTYS
jgi:hypothetical protein